MLITHNTETSEGINKLVPGRNTLAVLTALRGKEKGVRNVRMSPIESLFDRRALVLPFTQDNANLALIAVTLLSVILARAI